MLAVFLFNILNYLSSAGLRSISSAMAIADGSVAERLATLIDTLVVNGATDIMLSYKQKDLCSLLGTQRTTLVATLDKLSDDGIVEYDSGNLRILDLPRLVEIIRN